MRSLRIGGLTLRPGDTGIMAIVNRTPDSFHDAGATFPFGAALDRVDQVVAEGADVVDVGGVRAGRGPVVDEAEELRRVVPFLEAVRDRHPTLPLSVDTWRSGVARVALDVGVDLVNDTWSRADPALEEVVAGSDAALVCSHVGGLPPRQHFREVDYDGDVVAAVLGRTVQLAERAVALGVRDDGVLIDPTHDFNKTTAQSLELTRRSAELVASGWPVLVSVSRKDFIGETLDLPTDQRLAGTLAATTIAAWSGVRLVRAHDVEATRQTLDMVASIQGRRAPAAPRRGLADDPEPATG